LPLVEEDRSEHEQAGTARDLIGAAAEDGTVVAVLTLLEPRLFAIAMVPTCAFLGALRNRSLPR
jgi:hypothetical protein